jgi:succinoglycan biosynthesis transport protein ExoP
MDGGTRSFDIRPILRLVWDGRWLLFAGALIGMTVFGFQTFVLAEPQYRATAMVILDMRARQIVDEGAVVTGPSGETAEINTEVEVLRGRELLGHVVDALDLAADPEFNTALAPDPWTIRLKRTLWDAIPGAAERPARPDGWEREATIDALQNRVMVQAVPASFVFRVTATSTDPVKAARIADRITQAYIEGQIAQKAAAIDVATAALAGRVGELERALAASEGRLAELKMTQDALSPDDLIGLERTLRETRAAIARTEDEIATPLDQGDALAVIGRRDALVADEAALIERAVALSAAERQIDQALREVEVTRAIYEDFLTRLKETTVEREMIQPDSRILSQAVPPAVHATPRRSQTVTMGLVLGLLTAAAFLLLREGLTPTFRTAEEVEAATGLRVLASLPEMPGDTGRDILRGIAETPLSPGAEAVRLLRTSLSVEPGGPLPRVIMLTSALPDEGKTNVTAVLAQNLATVGLSVVVVETDLRRRAFVPFFGQAPRGGIVSVITGEAGIDDTIHTAEPWGFDVLAGITGTQAGLPDLLASDRFDDIMAVLRRDYDVVLIDTTPLLTAPDARIIGRHAETVLFCLRWNRTTRDEVRRALRVLDAIGPQPPGVVLTRVTDRPRGRLI